MRYNQKGGGRQSNQGNNRRGRGRGPPSQCVCPNPNCDYTTQHQPGQPCSSLTCPKCGTPLIRGNR